MILIAVLVALILLIMPIVPVDRGVVDREPDTASADWEGGRAWADGRGASAEGMLPPAE